MSLALLAGGRSTRMGEDKAFAPFNGTAPSSSGCGTGSAPLFPHVFVVTREPSRFHDLGLPVVNDALPEAGSAVGVYTAVLAAPTERVICLACDMPFVTPRFLRDLAEQVAGIRRVRPPARRVTCSRSARSTARGPSTPTASSSPRAAGGSSTSIPDLNTGYLDMDDGRLRRPGASCS